MLFYSAEWRVLSIIMLSVIVLRVVKLSVVMPNVMMLSVIMPNVIMLSVAAQFFIRTASLFKVL
jgi:hypothetical protein